MDADIGVQVRDVHLQSHAIDGHAALPEIANHGVDRVRLGVHHLRLGLVVKEQSLRIGFVRPAETVLNIGVLLEFPSGRARSKLDRGSGWSGPPDRAAQLLRDAPRRTPH
jgi:hypothetical protein